MLLIGFPTDDEVMKVLVHWLLGLVLNPFVFLEVTVVGHLSFIFVVINL